MAELLVGRQPILNRQKKTIGYELLYRALQTDTSARINDGVAATSQVFADTMFEMGLENIVGSKLAFINFTREFFVEKSLSQLLINIKGEKIHPEQLVLEVLEDITLDKSLLQALLDLRAKHFVVALDDVVSFSQVAPILQTGLVNIVKIDLMGIDRLILPDLVYSIKQNGILLLAEKVESPDDFKTCMRMGFDFFQGYFFSKPETIMGARKTMSVSRLNLLRSLAATMDPNADFHRLNGIISNDVSLSYKLLRLVNSGYFSFSYQINSIQQAISLIGLQQLRSWMMLLMMASVDNKPHELTRLALSRAKMCELLARSLGSRQNDSFFLIGLLSVLDAILDTPMEQVVDGLSLAPEISQALVNYDGNAGIMLSGVIATEAGNWDTILQFGIKPETWRSIYLESIKWSNLIMEEMDRESSVANS
ncbi:MAG: EAL and HDOD domain-containing protein [Anaerolineaceae bacterium]